MYAHAVTYILEREYLHHNYCLSNMFSHALIIFVEEKKNKRGAKCAKK